MAAEVRASRGSPWRRLRPLAVGMAILAAAITLNLTFGDGWAGADEAGEGARLAADPALVERGAELFGAHCAMCHGASGRGVFRDGPQHGPSLIGVGAASVDLMLRTGRMPMDDAQDRMVRGPERFDDDERRALVAYVESLAPGVGPDIPDVEGWEQGDLSRGLELFTANCAACHGPTGQGIAVGQRDVASPLDVATPLEIAAAVRSGPGVMPRFLDDTMDQDDLLAVTTWVMDLREREAPGGWSFGRSGPVAEGFIAFLVGLGLLSIVAYLLGERTEDTHAVPVERQEAGDGGE